MESANPLYTEDQKLGFLIDDALFSDSQSARVRAINQISAKYGSKSIPILEEIVKTLPSTDDVFRSICLNVINRMK
jgi:hypothetical protein